MLEQERGSGNAADNELAGKAAAAAPHATLTRTALACLSDVVTATSFRSRGLTHCHRRHDNTATL
jgi:hypothetical protein